MNSGGFKSKKAVLARTEIKKQVIKQFLSEDLNDLCDQINQSNFEKEFEKYIRSEASVKTIDKVIDLMKSMNYQMSANENSQGKKKALAARANGKTNGEFVVVDAHAHKERVRMLRSESE